MENEQFNERLKLMPKILGIIYIAYVIAGFTATQFTAKDCNYNPLLGEHFTIGDSVHIYSPFKFKEWQKTPQIRGNIPHIISHNNRYYWGIILLSFIPAYMVFKNKKVLTSHGTAAYAQLDEIKLAGLAEKNGVVVGKNPYDHRFMLHDGPEHIFLAAPTRAGKGVSFVIPTATVWPHSLFVFDPKGELWTHSAWWRKNHYKQPVMKFEPLCKNGSSAKWNPLAEIDYRGICEMDNAEAIAKIMTDPGEGNSDPFWKDSACAVVKGIIVHLLYQRDKEKRPIPCPSDIISFLSSPGKDKHHQFADMKCYPHITPEEFLEENGKENILKKIYGDYITDYSPFIKALKRGDKNNGVYFDTEMDNNSKLENPLPVIDILKKAILNRFAEDPDFKEGFKWDAPNFDDCNTQKDILKELNTANTNSPWYMLLVHPKVAESAATIINNEAASTVSSIISSAQTPLAIYQNPLIQKNTSTSDFAIRDLLNPDQAVSLYYVCAPNDIPRLAPLTRLFVTMMFGKLTQKMKFTNAKAKKQRIVLLLDEFPQLGKLDAVEHQLNICAGYGIKVVIVVQSINQINKIYTKDNGIMVGCPLSVFYAPADLETAKVISERLGDKTIETQSVSSNGEFFKSNVSTSQTARKLMTPEEVLRLSKDKEIVFTNGFRPVLGDKIKFFEEAYFDTRVFNPQKVKSEEQKKQTNKPVELQLSDVCTPVKKFSDLAALYEAEREADENEAKSIENLRKNREKKQSDDNNKPNDSAVGGEINQPAEKEEVHNEQGFPPTTSPEPDSKTEITSGSDKTVFTQGQPNEIVYYNDDGAKSHVDYIDNPFKETENESSNTPSDGTGQTNEGENSDQREGPRNEDSQPGEIKGIKSNNNEFWGGVLNPDILKNLNGTKNKSS